MDIALITVLFVLGIGLLIVGAMILCSADPLHISEIDPKHFKGDDHV